MKKTVISFFWHINIYNKGLKPLLSQKNVILLYTINYLYFSPEFTC